MKINYKFVNHGSCVQEKNQKEPIVKEEVLEIKNNTIYVDVGNSFNCENRVFDNHHVTNSKYSSVAKLCLEKEKEIRKHIEKIEEDEVEIISHVYPDLDSIVSTYIMGKYYKKEKLNEDFSILVDMVEEFDSGRMTYNFNKGINPCFIVYSMADVVGKKKSEEKNKIIMEKGLLLIDSILNGLKEQNENKSIENIDITKYTDIFNEEIEILKEDYNKYKMELNNPEICTKTKIILPLKGNDGDGIKEVDALFWSKISECTLHKYWARQDSSAPNGQGYVFTFIPSKISNKVRSVDESLNNLVKDSLNRAIISVNPESDVCLKGIAVALETAERQKEIDCFGGNIDKWRSREFRRYSEDWCDNKDPWYDGRTHGYTIIDSPGVGSLLTIDEMKFIVNNSISPQVDNYLLRYVIPFEIDDAIFLKLCNDMSKISTIIKDDMAIKRYFSSTIQNYMFENTSGEVEGNHSDNCNKYLYNIKKDNINELLSTEANSPLKILNNDLKVIIFKYGIGFMYFDIEFIDKEFNNHVDNILDIKNRLLRDEVQKKIFDLIVNGLGIKDKIGGSKKALIYSAINIKSKEYFEKYHKDIMYKLINSMNWQGDNYNRRYTEYMIDKDIIKADKNTYYGFSKNGGILLTIDGDELCKTKLVCDNCKKNNQKECINSTNIDKIKFFKEVDFYIFLLAVQQRFSLRIFDNKLSLYDKKPKKSDIERLRSLQVKFTTQGWFSEITEDKMGTIFYKKWTDIFENNNLYKEVNEQLSAVDDFYKARMTNKFTRVSTITFPIILANAVLSLFDIGYIITSPIAFDASIVYPAEGVLGGVSIGWGWPLITIFIALIVMYISYKRD